MLSTLIWILLWIVGIGLLTYHKVSKRLLSFTLWGGFLITVIFSSIPVFLLGIFGIALIFMTFLLYDARKRQEWIIIPLMQALQKHLPKISETEKTALEAGTVWWDGELFSGKPEWTRLLNTSIPTLSQEEQEFLKGPVETLCALVQDWEITAVKQDLPPAIWQFLQEHRFFGLTIPKNYGGLGFSALAHSEVLMKLAGCSLTLSSTVAVPNSLGPAELLLRYGTAAQKEYYLPRLAQGIEIPCFALTNPNAGSDATSIPDTGIVDYGIYQGKKVLGIRLNWDKRYITLAPKASLLGLAFKLLDPKHLFPSQTRPHSNSSRPQPEEKKIHLGITCALIPTDTPGISIGQRHYPLCAPFQNGPTQGIDVFIPLDAIIGGPAMAGQGWRMLVESLACGRAISLPSAASGACKFLAAATGAYAKVRKQFKQPIGHFEGIQEVLARMAGNAYLSEAARIMTAGAIDQGESPSILGAIIKYHLTERSRQTSIDAMDIHGGKAIMLGPKNQICTHYLNAPISITVEGANILTRNMIIFGQGVMRCHPYLLAELKILQAHDLSEQALDSFDRLLIQHTRYMLSNAARACWLGITAWIDRFIPHTSKISEITTQITRCSSAFALVTDLSLFLLGGKLKTKERISARLGDLLSMMYLASCALKRFYDQKQPKEDRVLIDWVIQETLGTFWNQMDALLRNFPNRWLSTCIRILVMPFGKQSAKPNDKLEHHVANLLLSPNPSRHRLIQGIYLGSNSDGLQLLEKALTESSASENAELNQETSAKIQKNIEELTEAIISVDDFPSVP